MLCRNSLVLRSAMSGRLRSPRVALMIFSRPPEIPKGPSGDCKKRLLSTPTGWGVNFEQSRQQTPKLSSCWPARLNPISGDLGPVQGFLRQEESDDGDNQRQYPGDNGYPRQPKYSPAHPKVDGRRHD